MPKFTKIANRTAICLSIDSKKRDLAKQKKVNISLLLDEALDRELMIENKEAFHQAVERKNKFYKDYIEKRDLQGDLDKYQEGDKENVVEEKKERTREDREDKRNIAGL